jgi:hypothetical protein
MSRKFLTLRGGVFTPGIIPYWLKLKSYWPKRVVVLEGGYFLRACTGDSRVFRRRWSGRWICLLGPPLQGEHVGWKIHSVSRGTKISTCRHNIPCNQDSSVETTLTAVGIPQGNQDPKNEDQPNDKASHKLTSFAETGVYGNLREAIFMPCPNKRYLLKTMIKFSTRRHPS